MLAAAGRITSAMAGTPASRARVVAEAWTWLHCRDGGDRYGTAAFVCEALGVDHASLLAAFDADAGAVLAAIHVQRVALRGPRKVQTLC